jgi:phage host-nuclease inhibitor protein Gam
VKKVKLNNLEPIKDPQAVNNALGELSHLKRELLNIEAELNADIDRLKAAAEAKGARLLKRREALEAGLEAYGQFNRDVFEKRRSLELTFGVIGFRRSTQIRPRQKTTWEMVLGKLRSLAFVEAIRTKEEPNKEILETWPEERLALVDCQRVVKDVFYYELKAEDVEQRR